MPKTLNVLGGENGFLLVLLFSVLPSEKPFHIGPLKSPLPISKEIPVLGRETQLHFWTRLIVHMGASGHTTQIENTPLNLLHGCSLLWEFGSCGCAVFQESLPDPLTEEPCPESPRTLFENLF